MPRVKRGKLVLPQMTEEEIAMLANGGDRESVTHLWEHSIPQIARIAGLFIRRYPWIAHDDLAQAILVEFPRLLARFNPWRARAKNITWNKYLYFSAYRTAQDILRREDPLGISIPQKAHYPSWRRFSEITDSSTLTEQIIVDGLAKMDKGDAIAMDAIPSEPDENNTDGASGVVDRLKQTAEFHDLQYHGSIPAWERDTSP